MSVKLVFTKLVNLMSLEQSHYKPMGMYCGGPGRLTDHHNTFPKVLDGVAVMAQGLYT